MVQPLCRTVWRYLKKLRTELPYVPAIPFLCIYLQKNMVQKDTRTTIFIAVLFTIGKTWKQPKYPSTDEWIKKIWYTYTMNYYSLIKKESNNVICSNMKEPVEISILSEVSSKEKDKCRMISLTCGI